MLGLHYEHSLAVWVVASEGVGVLVAGMQGHCGSSDGTLPPSRLVNLNRILRAQSCEPVETAY